MQTTITNEELQDLIADQLISDVCDFHSRFRGDDSLQSRQQLYAECVARLDDTLQECSVAIRYGTGEQQTLAPEWTIEVCQCLQRRLGLQPMFRKAWF
jgi:hypothetical protein